MTNKTCSRASLMSLQFWASFAALKTLKVVVEYLSPSFLVKKRDGGFHLVAAFTDVGHNS